jgi:regulatory protein
VAEWSTNVESFSEAYADILGSQGEEQSRDSGPAAKDVRRAAMDLLARREHGRTELCHKLKKRFSSAPELIEEPIEEPIEELIEEEVQKLAEEGLQSDSRLAEAFIRGRFNRGQGPVKIKAELRGKGINEYIISAAFDSHEVDWFQQISDVARRRFGDKPPVDVKERAKRGRFLLQRGFTSDQIRSLDRRHN